MRRVLLYNTTPRYTLIASGTGKAAASGSFTVTSIPAGTTLLVVVVACNTTPNVTDGSGNIYSFTTAYGSGQFTRQAYVVNPTTPTSMTFTITAIGWTATALFFKGSTIPTPAIDQVNGNNSTLQTSIATGSITPTLNGDLIIASACTVTGATGSPGAISGYTLIYSPFIAGTAQGLAIYYKTQLFIQAENVTFAGTSMVYTGAMIASYKN